jgi:hypothetical protein
MIRKGYRKDINEKINYIKYLIDGLNTKLDLKIEFDNINPNHYKLIYKNDVYEFVTYNDVINTLEIIYKINLLMFYKN